VIGLAQGGGSTPEDGFNPLRQTYSAKLVTVRTLDFRVTMEVQVLDANHPDTARERLFKIDVYVATDDVERVTDAPLELFSSMGASDPSFYAIAVSHAANAREHKQALLLLTD
jgi:hypothetical protein